MQLDKLFEGICTLVFEFDDGSHICCLTTLNRQKLQQLGLGFDGIYDLQKRTLIPEYLFDKIIAIEEGNTREEHLTTLDKIFEDGGKFWWSAVTETTTRT